MSDSVIVREGEPASKADNSAYTIELHPRTAAGLTRDGRTLILIVIDGRQVGYSEGATLAEVANLLIEYGAWTGLNLDGGGSADMVMAGADGRPQVLSSPASWWIPEDMIIVKELPHTGTGKVMKAALREQYGAEIHPDAVKLTP